MHIAIAKCFVDSIKYNTIIMTSNMGSHIIQEGISNLKDTNRENQLEEIKTKVLIVLKQSIRPEFINRIDEIVMFSPLTVSEIENIVGLQFKMIQSMMKSQNIKIDLRRRR